MAIPIGLEGSGPGPQGGWTPGRCWDRSTLIHRVSHKTIADRTFVLFQASVKTGLGPRACPVPCLEMATLKQMAAFLCHFYGSEVCSPLASGKSIIQLDTRICFGDLRAN